MSGMSPRRWTVLVIVPFLLVWSLAYALWPRVTFDDGPFFAEPFTAEVSGLTPLSSTNLMLLGATRFILETHAEGDPDAPGTVFLLKDPTGKVLWAKVTSNDFGRIHLGDRPPRWFLPGGWVVPLQPESTEGGALYLSPFGNFRFFFHSW